MSTETTNSAAFTRGYAMAMHGVLEAAEDGGPEAAVEYAREGEPGDGGLSEIVFEQALQHGLPWRVESDWTMEVRAADGYYIAKCQSREEAESIVALAQTFEDVLTRESPGE